MWLTPNQINSRYTQFENEIVGVAYGTQPVIGKQGFLIFNVSIAKPTCHEASHFVDWLTAKIECPFIVNDTIVDVWIAFTQKFLIANRIDNGYKLIDDTVLFNR